MEMAECGAASLAIILAFFKKYVPLEELRIECGVSRDGSNAFNIIKAARFYELEAKGYKKDLSEIYQIKGPAILFWEFNHFVVLEGFGKKKVYINDPATGPRTISYEEFDQSYTGIVLTFEKKETFKEGGHPPHIFEGLYQRFKGVKSPLLFLLLASLCLLLPGLAIPAFTRIFVDELFNSHLLAWQWGFLLCMLFTVAMMGILNFLQQFYLNRLQQKLSVELSSHFLWHILRLPLSFYMQRYSGEIAYRMQLNTSISETMTGTLATTVLSLILITFYGIVMFFYDSLIACIGFVAALLNITMLLLINRSRQDAFAKYQQDYGKSLGVSINALQAIDTIKATGSESDFFARWAGYYAKTVNSDQEIGKKDALLSFFPILTQSLAQAFLLGLGSWKVMQNELSLGMLMALQVLLSGFLLPVVQFVNFGALMQALKINIARLDDVLKNPIDEIYNKQSQSSKDLSLPVRLSGYLTFRNVTFGYSPLADPLLKQLSFSLKPGQRIALVGPSGSGKSTIGRLACSLFQPWEGEILYDGKKFEDIPRELTSRSIASVDQEIFLFSGTVRQNLTLWDPTIPEEDLVLACKDACIHEEILAREKAYDSSVTEKGKNFSGGERQKLEIARALLFNPTILILDEATSALDPDTEKTIIDNIRRRGCTCIMIAHRLSTIRECDEILVLHKGKIQQRGNHQSLKEEEGLYRELVKKEEWSEHAAF